MNSSEWQQWVRDSGTTMPSARCGDDKVPSEAALTLPVCEGHRRLDKFGRCVLATVRECLQTLPTPSYHAMLLVSRYGNLPLLESLLADIDRDNPLSPTAFTHSTHNRLAGFISTTDNFTGITGASACMRDSFAMTMLEAMILIDEAPERRVLVVCCEPEIPERYRALVASFWIPHAGAFLLGDAGGEHVNYSFYHDPKHRFQTNAAITGSCLSFVTSIATGKDGGDGNWGWRRA